MRNVCQASAGLVLLIVSVAATACARFQHQQKYDSQQKMVSCLSRHERMSNASSSAEKYVLCYCMGKVHNTSKRRLQQHSYQMQAL